MSLKRVTSVFSGIFLTAMSFSAYHAQAASPFGYEIGTATKKEISTTLGRKVEMKNAGANIFTQGTTLTSEDCDALNMKGLEKLTVIFDREDKLSAMVLNLKFLDISEKKKEYNVVIDALKDKYELKTVSPENAPDKLFAYFTSPNGAYVRLTSKRLGDTMVIQYLSKDFVKSYSQMKNAPKQTELTEYDQDKTSYANNL